MNEITRRSMVAGSIAGAGVLLSNSQTTADKPAKAGWIDAHSHIWTRDIQKFPLAKGATLADLKPPSFTDDELLTLARRSDVDRVVLIAHTSFYAYDNAYLIHAARRHPGTFSVVGAVDDRTPHPDRAMRKLVDDYVRGFRITNWFHKDKWLDGPGMAAMWKTGAETGQAMCCLIDPDYIGSVDRMCERFPQTPVVIDHFARIGVDGVVRPKHVAELARLARHKHTHVKLSAYYALGKKKPPYLDLVPMIRRMLDAFGPERCMWASDAPYQLLDGNSYEASIELIRDRLEGLTAGDRAWLLRRTAERVYFS